MSTFPKFIEFIISNESLISETKTKKKKNQQVNRFFLNHPLTCHMTLEIILISAIQLV